VQLALKESEFSGKTHMGTFLDIYNARATVALFGKLHYNLFAVCDEDHRFPFHLDSNAAKAETAKLHC